MVANRDSTGAVITIPLAQAVSPFSYRASLQFDALGRLVITG